MDQWPFDRRDVAGDVASASAAESMPGGLTQCPLAAAAKLGVPIRMPAKPTRAGELIEAFEQGQFKPYFQPLVSVPSRALQGFELLVRWYRPGAAGRDGIAGPERIVEPGHFLAALRRAGMGAELDLAMVSAAIRFAAGLERHGGEPRWLHVNLSPESLNDRGTMARLLEHLERDSGHASRIVIEVTEESKLSAQGVASLHELRAAGIRIAIDDFGQGLSSLMRLLELPVDIVKLDRKILRLCRGQHGVTMLGCIVWMLRARGVSVVAEGIEDRIDWEFAVMSGCDSAQGYGIARPMPVAAAMELALGHSNLPAPSTAYAMAAHPVAGHQDDHPRPVPAGG